MCINILKNGDGVFFNDNRILSFSVGRTQISMPFLILIKTLSHSMLHSVIVGVDQCCPVVPLPEMSFLATVLLMAAVAGLVYAFDIWTP